MPTSITDLLKPIKHLEIVDQMARADDPVVVPRGVVVAEAHVERPVAVRFQDGNHLAAVLIGQKRVAGVDRDANIDGPRRQLFWMGASDGERQDRPFCQTRSTTTSLPAASSFWAIKGTMWSRVRMPHCRKLMLPLAWFFA